jgi:hypothetical protein
MEPRYAPGVYVRLTVKVGADGHLRRCWAKPVSSKSTRLRVFRVVDIEGEQQDEIIYATQNDIVRELDARMNLNYIQLEVIKKQESK